jgi:hypothetical protein
MTNNLFDLSGGGKEKKPEKNRQGPDRTKNASDVIAELKSMQEMHTKIEKQLEEAYQKAGVDPKELSKYCENPDNFTPGQWLRYKQSKEQVEMQITGLSKETLSKTKEEKAKSQVSKERRGKTLGSRKNWLNMH